nr:HEPN domain-containing protein [Enterobacter mori]
MCFSSIITALEAYIGDIMKREVLNNETLKRRFVEKSGVFTEQKMKVEAIYNFLDGLDKRITEELDNTSFHNIQTTRKMLREVLLIEIPNNLVSELNRAVIKRHDIVHRNGRSPNGQSINVTRENVMELINLVVQCIENIDQQVLDALTKDNDENE